MRSARLIARPECAVTGADVPREEKLVQTKETVKAVLDRLPDDCSLDDVLSHPYVVQAVAPGRADVEAGRTLSHEQVAEELRRKWLTGSAK